MRDPAFRKLKQFLSLHWKEKAPLLLACSGGPDSKALLYLLFEAQKFFNLEIQVAHIDHRWRKESRQEAEILQKEVEHLGLRFHLRTLEDVPSKEEAAREARYAQLFEIAAEIGAQAIVLGHQMEDQAETVLKRVLEGASLPSCCGMKEVSGLLWRPLLAVSKKELTAYLDKRKISYFNDPTNLDAKYLRGRFRTSIIPQLEAAFGKSIVKNLCLLGQRAQKLEEHFTKASESLKKVSDLQACDEALLEFFLKSWSKRQGVHLSREALPVFAKKITAQDPETLVELALKIQNDYLSR